MRPTVLQRGGAAPPTSRRRCPIRVDEGGRHIFSAPRRSIYAWRSASCCQIGRPPPIRARLASEQEPHSGLRCLLEIQLAPAAGELSRRREGPPTRSIAFPRRSRVELEAATAMGVLTARSSVGLLLPPRIFADTAGREEADAMTAVGDMPVGPPLLRRGSSGRGGAEAER
ncbi:unnamed protein product [Urochloa humidicola]